MHHQQAIYFQSESMLILIGSFDRKFTPHREVNAIKYGSTSFHNSRDTIDCEECESAP